MHKAQLYFPECPEAYIVSLARSGDRGAFAELVRRRQSSIRNLMRRCCSDASLADDLAQQVFLQLWLKIRSLKQVGAFNAWLKRLAVTTWLQYLRKNDALKGASELKDAEFATHDVTGVGMDVDHALTTLPDTVRLCVVLSFHEGMSHREIAEITEIPLGTVKSHINRGSKRLQEILSAYKDKPGMEES